MRSVVTDGTGQAAKGVPDARGKTGTTNATKDAWFSGYTDGVLGVGWVGNEKKIHGIWTPVSMRNGVYGGTITAGIWAKIMMVARDKYAKKIDASPVVAEKPKVKPKVDEDGDPIPASPDDFDNIPTTDTNDDGSPRAVVTTDPDGPDGTTTTDPSMSRDPAATPKPPKKTAKGEDSDTVQVEVCADTGLRANPYCPETVTRTFPRGKEPKKVCKLHGPGQ